MQATGKDSSIEKEKKSFKVEDERRSGYVFKILMQVLKAATHFTASKVNSHEDTVKPFGTI